MLVDRSREKLINSVIFFASRTKVCGKIKLFKLLYLLDFEHFKQTGRSVTGLEYHAWKYGPVPVALEQEWDDVAPDLKNAVAIVPEKTISDVREVVIPKKEFDDSHFSKREMRLLATLAEEHANVICPSMIDVTRVENGAWARVWENGKGFDREIPYALSLASDHPNREAILHAMREYAAIRQTDRDRAQMQ